MAHKPRHPYGLYITYDICKHVRVYYVCISIGFLEIHIHRELMPWHTIFYNTTKEPKKYFYPLALEPNKKVLPKDQTFISKEEKFYKLKA